MANGARLPCSAPYALHQIQQGEGRAAVNDGGDAGCIQACRQGVRANQHRCFALCKGFLSSFVAGLGKR
jgi:hypothetical protein